MSLLSHEDRLAVIDAWASSLQEKLTVLLASEPNEADFRRGIDPLLEAFCREMGLSPVIHAEYTLATGRADAVFNRLVVEYERPGVLKTPRDQATRHAVKQVRDYIEGLARREGRSTERLAGVVFDGRYLVFVRRIEGRWVEEGPVEVNAHSLHRLLSWLASLASGLALTAENLSRDFSLEQPTTRDVLLALFTGLSNALRHPDSMTSRLFQSWRLFFSEAIDYSEAFGGRKLQALQKWVRKAGLQVHTSEEAERFFFVLHTYFALLVKLLAWLALSRHMALRLGAPSFAGLRSADSEILRRQLGSMEDGGIFRAYGLANLLEGDFFSWYLHTWGGRVEDALRGVLRRLDLYDPATLSITPEETRDLFKQLYHYLLPREIRHALGEYYTPDWLAQRLLTQVDSEFFTARPDSQERVLRKKLMTLRFLDPACGSGTFLVLIIARMRELGSSLLVPEHEVLEAILRNVVGFDLNPLAVLTARVNYLLTIADLLPHRRGAINIPVYLADSIRTPAEGEGLFAQDTYEFSTAVGRFSIPAAVASPERFSRFCDLLEESVRGSLDEDAFLHAVAGAFVTSVKEQLERAESHLRRLYQSVRELHRQGMDGLWARLLKNNFAPLTVGQFDYVVGNPPWVNWEHLPDEYRDSIKPIWVRYGLFPHEGIDTILGKGKKDIAMLMTYTVCDTLLKLGGRLGFVITQSVLKTSGAGEGFRKFSIPQGAKRAIPLRVVHADDMVALNPFEGASNRTAVLIVEKGLATRFPVPYTVWRKQRNERFAYDSTLAEVIRATARTTFVAEPVDRNDPSSSWLTARPRAVKAVQKLLGVSEYQAHAGAYTGGANAVYWLEVVTRRPDGLVVVRNITEGAKVQVEEVIAPIEPDLLYPLLRGHDVRRWRASPSVSLLMVQDPARRTGIDVRELQTRYPRTYGYLTRFEKVLRKRRSRGVSDMLRKGSPFYTMFAVGDYTFSPWKAVWTRLARIEAAVVGKKEGKPAVPQETVTMVPCGSEEEAHYIAALVNSIPFQFAAASYSQEGGKSMGSMHLLQRIRIPRFDPQHARHQRLAELSMKAHRAVESGATATLAPIEADIDSEAAQLWGLTGEEVREMRRSLEA